MVEIADMKFRIWLAMKIINTQEIVEIQSKELKEFTKMTPELKDKIAILKKSQTDLIEHKNTLQEFHNTIKNIKCRIDQDEETISELENSFVKTNLNRQT